MNTYLAAAALATTAALAAPAAASAHPSVYQSTAKIGATATDETRYFVTNHGYSMLFKESNGLEGKKGVVAYNLAPSAWRTGKPFNEVMDAAGTGVQAHATCVGAAGLENEPAIQGWQGTDAFYNYVPFQTTSAGLEDDPAKWLPTLQTAGVDLAALGSDPTAACKALGGTYTPADAIAGSATALAEGMTKPIEQKLTTATTQVANLASELSAAKTQLAGMMIAATPLKLTLASAKAKTGVKVTVSGQPLKPVAVTVSVSDAQARKLKLASTVIGRRTVSTAADGTASVTVKLSAKAVKAIKKPVFVTAEAASGDRFATAKGKVSR